MSSTLVLHGVQQSIATHDRPHGERTQGPRRCRISLQGLAMCQTGAHVPAPAAACLRTLGPRGRQPGDRGLVLAAARLVDQHRL